MRKMHQNTFGVFWGFFFYHSVVNNVAHIERSKAWRFRNVPHGSAGAAVTWSRCVGDHELSDVTTGPVPAMKSEAAAIFTPQDGRWKITVSFDGRRFCVPKFRH